ncbi:CAP domain-containing protein [Pseudonocardia ailaonensis]|uniref:CAP domain-containing protein n=1 Tax=Pseudonocardia ailaonensis TaxID=367279 RepID=UPI0031D457E9
MAGLAVGAVLAAVGVLAVVPTTWAVVLAGDSRPAPATTPPRALAAVLPTTSPPAPALPPAPPPDAPATSAPPTTTTTTTTPPPTTTAPPRTTTPRPVTTPPPSGPAAQVVALTNQARAAAGCGALRTDPRLTQAAQGHSADMAARNYFAHDSQDGRSFADRIEAAGYPSPGAENIAMGQPTAQAVVTAWMNSPGHRRNIEDCSLTTIGVGLDTDGMYWTQDFGR